MTAMQDSLSRPLKVVITAGEASGDTLGARLMASIRAAWDGPVTFLGIGGPLMQAEGLRSLFPMDELSLMGVFEIAPRALNILKRIRQTAELIVKEAPDIVVTVDAPDFSFRVAEKVRARVKSKSLMVHCVAPTVWAWRPERAAKVARLYDGLICLFPFEPDYFIKEGMAAAFTGHPMMESVGSLEQGMRFRKRRGIPEDAFVLGILCGSRKGELKRTGPILRDAVELAAREATSGGLLHIVAPTLHHLRGEVGAMLKSLPYPVHVGSADKGGAFASMDAAVAVSGTVALELAVAGVPHVIGYRMNPLTWEIVRRKVKVKYAHLANLLLDNDVVPERLQDRCTAGALAEELAPLFSTNGAASTAQRTAFARLRGLLSGSGQGTPSDQAGRYILDLWKAKTQPKSQ